jgi:hypothetical protein
VVGVHRRTNTRGIRLALVTPRPPFRLFRYKLVVNPSTVYTYWQIVKHVILPTPPAVLAYVIGMVTDLEFGSRSRSA